MDLKQAKAALDKIIRKGRVHLYKPTQIAEILHRDRVQKDIDLGNLETYRAASRRWRDAISLRLVGRTSTSSARYQDDVFNDNATPPEALVVLGAENRKKDGIVEAYIYSHLEKKHVQMSNALVYAVEKNRTNFELSVFLDLFWKEPGLKRSIDKLYEIVVYSLFHLLVTELKVVVKVKLDPDRMGLLQDFKDFASKVMGIRTGEPTFQVPARVYRVGVTNAADRGLDMWANFGPAIQIKHLTLDEELAESIVSEVTADRIVIVCKKAEQGVIVSLMNQLGWKSRIQSVITEDDLISWYERALRGTNGKLLGDKLLKILEEEIINEFPSSEQENIGTCFKDRGYTDLQDPMWEAI